MDTAERRKAAIPPMEAYIASLETALVTARELLATLKGESPDYYIL